MIVEVERQLVSDSCHPCEQLYLDLKADLVDTFCEYALADSNYTEVQLQAIHYGSLAKYIQHNQLCLSQILKCLTYIIWTDEVVEGYMYNRIKDQSVGRLVRQLNFSLSSRN